MNKQARTLSFSDNGTGMDRQEIEDFLSVIGRTGTGRRAQELAARDVAVATIGQFGIDLLSAFVVADRIEVYTRKPGAAQTWRWTNHGGEDYDLVDLPADVQPPGTRVAVTLAPNQTAFLDERLIRQAVRRYADLLPFPILLNGVGEVRDGLRRQLLDLLLNADNPLVQRLGELTDPDHPRYRPILTGLYYSALLNARHRLTPAAARHFHADFQALLSAQLDWQTRHEP